MIKLYEWIKSINGCSEDYFLEYIICLVTDLFLLTTQNILESYDLSSVLLQILQLYFGHKNYNILNKILVWGVVVRNCK